MTVVATASPDVGTGAETTGTVVADTSAGADGFGVPSAGDDGLGVPSPGDDGEGVPSAGWETVS
jgi:hypothetical protein